MPILAALHFPSQLEPAGRILLAGALGGFIGFERELADHPAGLRTHISVALGAALFAVLSGYGFGAFQAGRNDTNFQVDPWIAHDHGRRDSPHTMLRVGPIHRYVDRTRSPPAGGPHTMPCAGRLQTDGLGAGYAG